MQYYRCKCGKSESWGSMPPPRCLGCPECGTNLAAGPDAHQPPKPHRWAVEQVETDEGPRPLTRCQWCHKTKAEIERTEFLGSSAPIVLTLDQMNMAFTKAEEETAEHYLQGTCSMPNKAGESDCPICYFRLRTKVHLGIRKEGMDA